MDPDTSQAAGRVDRWTTFDAGGHFPAMEVPELVVSDLRAFFTDGPERVRTQR